MQYGTLYFIPVTLGDDAHSHVIPKDVISITHTLERFIVENEKTARRFLKAYQHPKPIRALSFNTLNTQTSHQDLPQLLNDLLAGHDVGLMSEAGCPGIADPGAKLAALAHQKGIRVAPLVGPSSILLSLMGSGLNGQQFSFLGYLSIDAKERIQSLKHIEKTSKANGTQIFIETPYRNQQMLQAILDHCHGSTKLCIACHVSLLDEYIVTKTINGWKQSKALPALHKKPTVFLLQA